MEFTGERFIPGKCDIALELEHMNRYRFARALVPGRRVLDIACGSGYGSALLAEAAASVIGVDISEEAVRYCQETYQRENLSFAVGDVANIPLADASVDAVVSFETLEHVELADQLRFFHEAKRVLAPGGLLVISTPNKEVYDERGDNEFHKHELSAAEFSAFLEGSFQNVRLCGQITEVCNLISGGAADTAAWHGALDASQAEYLIAVASDAPLPETAPSVLPREDGRLRALTDWAVENDGRVHELAEWGKGLDEEIARRGETIDGLNRQVDTLAAWGKKLDGEIARQGETITGLNERVEELSAWGKGLDEQLAQRDAVISERNASVASLEAQRADLEAQRADLEAQRASLQARVSDLEQKETQLNLIESSKAWKVARGLQKVSGALLPMGSRRRLVARYTFRFLRHPAAMIGRLRADRGRIANFRTRLQHGDSAFSGMQEASVAPREPLKTEAVQPAKALEEYAPLSFPAWPQPQVSIVIPVYNQFEYTYECLRSILANTPDVSYEVIIADDCSTDNTARITELVGNIRVARTETNQRFLRNCNNAAKHARGEYIFFLNNDTQVQPDWLGSLVRLMERDENIGMCGSKLVYPDGRLQEAGGILWRDGSAWNFGNRQDPNAPEFNYVKDVDYISGAAIMIRADLWRQLGGFDDRFAPAYCEDSDLAMSVWAAGRRVVYQPASVVVHFEGVSNGTDTSTGLKAYQVKNQATLYEKWKDALAGHNENAVDPFVARERAYGKKTLLMIDHYVPEPDRDAGSRTIVQYLRMFVEEGYNVKFIGDNFFQSQPYTSDLQQMGVEVLVGPWYMEHWKDWLRVNGKHIDYVWLNRPHISIKYIEAVKKYTSARTVYYGMDLVYLREMRRYETTGDKDALAASQRWKAQEYEIMRNVDVSYFLSQVEIDEVAREDPAIRTRHMAINIFEDLSAPDYKAAARDGLIFVGGFRHDPNVDAVRFLHDQILPLVRAKLPDIRVHIVGSNPPEELTALADANLIMHGYLSDEELLALYGGCRMAIIPLRYGAGVKGKVIEAMRYGLPVVTTPIGAEGIDGAENVLQCAGDAQGLAELLLRLYPDAARLDALSAESYAYVQEHFSPAAAKRMISADFAFNDHA